MTSDFNSEWTKKKKKSYLIIPNEQKKSYLIWLDHPQILTTRYAH